jgi:CHAT domain-containing protein
VLYKSQGKYSQAEPYYLRSLAIWESMYGKNHPNVADMLNNLAWLYVAQNKNTQAEPLVRRLESIATQSLESWLQGAGNKTRQDYFKGQKSRRMHNLSFYSLQNLPEEALSFSLNNKGILLRISSASNALIKQNPDSLIQKKNDELKKLYSEISNLYLSGNKNDDADIEIMERKINTLEMQLSQSVPQFKRGKTEVTPKQVMAKLKNNQVLIDFLVYDEVEFKNLEYKKQQLIAVVADKNSVKLIKLGEMQPINQAIQAYHQVIEPKKGATKAEIDEREKTLADNAQFLYRKLWQPLLSFVQNKTQIYIVPDGALNVFPLNAMRDETGHYLIENYPIHLLSSARDIVLPPVKSGDSQASAIFAGIYYDKAQALGETTQDCQNRAVTVQRSQLSPVCYIKEALAEGQEIQKQIQNKGQSAQLISGLDATETAVKQLKSPRFLLLATHGFFLGDQPIDKNKAKPTLLAQMNDNQSYQDNPLTRSGVALANANDSLKHIVRETNADDGILTALEVLGMDLENTELVTLSACQTALGNIQIGEGVYSLNRAFQEAGAKAVLSTLWRVDSKKTPVFMQHFYTQLLNDIPPQQALRDTQKDYFLKNKGFSDPYYWAGFSMVGL